MRCYAAKAARKASLFAFSPLFEAEFVNRQRSCRPCAVELPTAGGLRELMKAGGRTTHVGGRSEDHGIGGVEFVPVCVGDAVHRDEGDVRATLLCAAP